MPFNRFSPTKSRIVGTRHAPHQPDEWKLIAGLIRAMAGILYIGAICSRLQTPKKGMTRARKSRVLPIGVESRWSPNATCSGFGVQLASKFNGAKSFVFSKRCL
jgi:hypothetical protein